MASTINAQISPFTAVVMEADNSGNLALQTANTTAVTIDSSQNTSLANSLAFTATGARITGDFNNATVANRVAFQTSTSNGATSVHAIPNGIGTTAQFEANNNSDPTNSSNLQTAVLSTEATIRSSIRGTGTYLPLTMYTGGSERVRVDTSGNVGIGTSSPSQRLDVSNVSRYTFNLANSYTLQTSINAAGSAFADDYKNALSHIWQTSGTERMRLDASGNLLFDSGYGAVATAYGCRAWVNFNGTGTVAIRASGNVSSITDSGTGYYTINFTNAMVDANYSVVGLSSGLVATGTGNPREGSVLVPRDLSTTLVRVLCQYITTADTRGDAAAVCVGVFR